MNFSFALPFALTYCAGTLIWIFLCALFHFACRGSICFCDELEERHETGFFHDLLSSLTSLSSYQYHKSICVTFLSGADANQSQKTNLINCWIYFWWWYISPVSGTKFWTDIGNWSLYLSFSYSMSNWFKAQGNTWNHLQLVNESIPSNFYALLLICWLILESIITTNLREQSEHQWGTDKGWEMQNWPASFREPNGYLTVFKVQCENSFILVLVKMI